MPRLWANHIAWRLNVGKVEHDLKAAGASNVGHFARWRLASKQVIRDNFVVVSLSNGFMVYG